MAVNPIEFGGLIFVSSGPAGFLGALTGLGGGAGITPALTVLFGVDTCFDPARPHPTTMPSKGNPTS